MTLDEGVKAFAKVINNFFADDPTPEEAEVFLRRVRQDIEIMLAMIETDQSMIRFLEEQKAKNPE